jgi:hypothetical protein
MSGPRAEARIGRCAGSAREGFHQRQRAGQKRSSANETHSRVFNLCSTVGTCPPVRPGGCKTDSREAPR